MLAGIYLFYIFLNIVFVHISLLAFKQYTLKGTSPFETLGIPNPRFGRRKVNTKSDHSPASLRLLRLWPLRRPFEIDCDRHRRSISMFCFCKKYDGVYAVGGCDGSVVRGCGVGERWRGVRWRRGKLTSFAPFQVLGGL